MELSDFVRKYDGCKVDFDGVYGAQCVDLFRQYAKECLVIPEHTGSAQVAEQRTCSLITPKCRLRRSISLR